MIEEIFKDQTTEDSNLENCAEDKPLVIIAGLDYGIRSDFAHSMDELGSLVDACDMKVVSTLTQNLSHPDPGTYFGRGKIAELSDLADEYKASFVVIEDNLSPGQLRNIESLLKVEVWDRTMLILEIFTKRARTREARLQVESAYLQYMLPRLSGMWQHLGRQGGGGGSRANKGEGETQIELDRRQIRHRIDELRRELKLIEKTRNTQREGRSKGQIPSCALVGYTNAGKSTIMNHLLIKTGVTEDKRVFEKNMLFATLDTSIRRIETEDNRDFLLSDTVGFIENLPHDLVKAFRSTLEEAVFADLLLIVLDASDENVRIHKDVTEKTLKEIGASDIPRLYVMNKSDLLKDMDFKNPVIRDDTIYISAAKDIGMTELVNEIQNRLYLANVTVDIMLPYNRGDLLDLLHRKANISLEEYTAEGTHVIASCPQSIAGKINF